MATETIKVLGRAVELNVGESAEVVLGDGSSARVKVVSLDEQRDGVRNAVRLARVRVEVNGEGGEVVSGNYELPIVVGGVQIDCPVTKGYMANAHTKPWGLEKDVRLRLWPAGSAWVEAGTFVYPVTQRWFAGPMQTGNEPVYVDGAERPARDNIYYHDGLDFGGAERDVEILSATNGIVIVAGEEMLAGENEAGSQADYDCVVIRDGRGWYVEYNHVLEIDPAVRPGTRVRMGQKIGLLGKTGGSGGWSHLHFCIKARQPSGKFGTEPSYAYAWEAWQREHPTDLIAVARPHRFGTVGETIVLDGSRSWSRDGRIASAEWRFSDGGTASGMRVERRYERAGVYSEILRVTNGRGQQAWDFAVVEILDGNHPNPSPVGIHASFAPTMNLKAGDAITFQVRTFNTTFGEETWDFGDGSAEVKTRSDGNVDKHAKDGYAKIVHHFEKPGDYIVSVQRSNEREETATARLWVPVQQAAG